MDKCQAEQLEKRINREASYLVTSLKDVSVIGEQLWGVSIYARSSGSYLGDIESSSEWEERKQVDLKYPSHNG